MQPCPECGYVPRTPTARAMAIHRAMMHGVAGASKSAQYRARHHAPQRPPPRHNGKAIIARRYAEDY